MEPFETEIFGKYYLVDRIATGGMAEVFRAKTFAVGGFESLFVVKRILAHLGEDPEFLAMFVDEAKISVALQHPNIVRVFDFGKEGPHFFIAMEHVEGRDLRRVLRASGQKGARVPIAVAAWIVSETTKGLQFAHSRIDGDGASLGIVHRDISPANVLLSVEGDVKVADFGIAKAESNLIQTDGSVLKGKYAYMSPEQVEGQPVDGRTDIFSLGIVLWEMLAGRRAFRGEDDEETLRRVRDVDLPALRELNPEVPEPLAAVVDKALAKDPADRWQTPREMGEALRESDPAWSEDKLRRQFSTWLLDLIGDGIAEDRARLDEGTRIAAAMHELRTASPDAAPPEANGRLVGVLSVALVGMIALAISLAMLEPPEIPTVPVAVTGSLDVDVTPAARVFVSGREVGEAEILSVPDLAPGVYEVRLEAEGYLPHVESIRVTRGGATRVRQELTAGLGEDAPAVRFVTVPAGATLRIDDEEVGVTPTTWHDGWPDRAYRVSLELDGYEPWTTTLEDLELREERQVTQRLRSKATPRTVAAGLVGATARPTPPPTEAGTGSLRVVLTGATWANVYVDGQKLPRTAPFSGVSLPAGAHTVRVENAAAGLDHTQSVTVGAGKTATVRALVR